MLKQRKEYVALAQKLTSTALLPSVLIYVFGAFGSVAMNSTVVYLTEQAVCRTHYTSFQPTAIRPGGLIDEELCKIPEVQRQVANINGIHKVFAFLPGSFNHEIIRLNHEHFFDFSYSGVFNRSIWATLQNFRQTLHLVPKSL